MGHGYSNRWSQVGIALANECDWGLAANGQRPTTKRPATSTLYNHLGNPMSERTFTLDEAQMLLPVLESLLKQGIQGKKLIEEVDAELQETSHRIFLNGGTLVNVVHLAGRKAAREKAIQRIKDAVAEI